MTFRQRVLAAVARKQPDRVPLDLGGTESSSLTGMAWHRLMAHLGLDAAEGPEIVDPVQQVARVDQPLQTRFGIDTVGLYLEPASWTGGTLGNGQPCRVPAGWRPVAMPEGDQVITDSAGQAVARMPRGGFYFDSVHAPLADLGRPGDLEKRRDVIAANDLPAFWDEPVAATAGRARKLHEQTDLAVVFNFCCHLLHGGTGLRGYEQFMMDLAADRPMAETLLEILLESYLARIDRYAPALRGHVDVVLFNDDLGTQNGPMISQRIYNELIQPRQARLFGHAKKMFAAPILFHSCGAVSEFIPGLVAAGADALNPVQVSAGGMDSARLKREFGKDICFWGGGCDSQRVLCGGTPRQVREEVKRRIGDFAPGGGFVFTQVHNVQPDVPAENIVAMLDAARQFAASSNV